MTKLEDFDNYVDRYENLLKDQLSFFDSDRDYFSSYKVERLKKIIPFTPKRILDFGSGIGLSLPHFLKAFPSAQLFATDTSKKSLEFVSKHFSDVTVLEDEALDQKEFDVIFLSGVLHHVPTNEHLPLLKRVKTLLASQGVLTIFEHNPFNPVTRRMVAMCPFDRGVCLLRKKQMQDLLEQANFYVTKGDYCLFFPGFLKGFRFLEPKLGWLPLGGQYFTIAQHN